jgi:hypothetical protein
MVRSARIRFFVELQPDKFHLPYALPRCGKKLLAIATPQCEENFGTQTAY